jgi:hypothetical protein
MMIPSHAPPYYFPGLTLMEYLQSFYCWYIGSFDNRNIQLIFHRFLALSQEDILSNESKNLLIEEFHFLADALRFSSITLSRLEQNLLRIEEKITQDNPKAKLISLLFHLRSKTDLMHSRELSAFLPLLTRLDPKKLDRFMSHATIQLLAAYLKNPSSTAPLYELQNLFRSWNDA